MHNEPNFDELLDRALSDYSAQEPPLSLEARALRHATAARPMKRYFWFLIPALAAATLTIVLIPTRVPELPATPYPEVSGTAPLATDETAKDCWSGDKAESCTAYVATRLASFSQLPSRDRKGAVPIRPVHQPIFAPPELPTTQQLALLALATNYPQQAADLTREVPADLTIQPLTMEPLSMNALDQ